MSEQYAIVPFVAQAEPVQMPKEFEPRMLAEQYGSHVLRFLYPLAQELHTRYCQLNQNDRANYGKKP